MSGDVVEIRPRPGAAGRGERPAKERRQVRDTTNDPPWLAAISYSSGAIQSNPLNVETILVHHAAWDGVLAWDQLQGEIRKLKDPPWLEITRAPGSSVGTWSSTDTTRLASWLFGTYALLASEETCIRAVRMAAERRPVHPIKDWLDALTFEPDPAGSRLETWAIRYLGAPDTPYVRAVSRWFLLSAVARVYEPGCKVDTMIILEGAQGLRKSSALHALFGEGWCSDTPPDLQSKDRFGAVRGKWLIEFAELDAFGKADAARIKAFVSSSRDRYRPPYERVDIEAPRGCVFAGTVNRNGRGYLQDETGNRRFWPIPCAPCGSGADRLQVDIAGLREAREAIWAEAREVYNPAGAEHARWWPETPEEHDLCSAEQDERVHTDVWEERIGGWLLDRLKRREPDPFVTLGQVLNDAIGMEPAKQDHQAQTRAARVLVQAGWSRSQKRTEDGRVRGFRPGLAAVVASLGSEQQPLLATG